MMGSRIRAALRLFFYSIWTILLLPVQAAAVLCDAKFAESFPRFYHRTCLWLLGFKVAVRGAPATQRPVLFVSNHTSYLDILVLGALVPASFVAKHEVAGWPGFGTLAKLQRTVFIDRAARRRAHQQRDEITRRLERGHSLVLFPEGTSDNGSRVLPFKSALLGAAETAVNGRLPVVQPVSIAYTRLDGAPMGRAWRPFFAWYGDMNLLPHLWKALGLGTVTVEVEFHAPITAAEFPSRKALSDYCRRQVAEGIALALSGRAQEVSEIAGQIKPMEPSAVAGRP